MTIDSKLLDRENPTTRSVEKLRSRRKRFRPWDEPGLSASDRPEAPLAQDSEIIGALGESAQQMRTNGDGSFGREDLLPQMRTNEDNKCRQQDDKCGQPLPQMRTNEDNKCRQQDDKCGQPLPQMRTNEDNKCRQQD